MTMITSSVFSLRFLADSPAPAVNWWGRAVHGLFFNAVTDIRPSKGDGLHQREVSEVYQPFTASTLLGSFSSGIIKPDERYSFRITTLNEEMHNILLKSISTGGRLSPGAKVSLANREFSIESIAQNEKEHAWARTASYQSLVHRFCLNSSELPDELTFHFVSPTFYKDRKKGAFILPLAEWVFNSLRNKWNQFSPDQFPTLGEARTDGHLSISRYQLRSQAVHLRGWNTSRVGGVGEITFRRSDSCSDDLWQMLCLLAAYARFAGVGAAAPLGFGQCWVEPF